MTRRPNQYRGKMDELRAERGKRCECLGCAECQPGDGRTCGRGQRLEFAHLRPTGLRGRSRGRAERYRDIKKNPDAYRLMCWWCHHAMDQGTGPALPQAHFFGPALDVPEPDEAEA